MKRKFLSKIIATIVIATTVSTLAPIAVSASWIKDYNSWKYIDGSGVATGWKQIDGTWYFFDYTGNMKTGWLNYGGNTYYFDASGAMQTGVIQIDKKIYIFSDNGIMQTSTVVLNGVSYKLYDTGVVHGENIPTPTKGFDYYGNSVIAFTPDQIIDEDDDSSTPEDSFESASDASSNSSNEYTLTYKDDDGDKLKAKTVKKDDKITLYEPTKSGYKFVEWNTKKDGSGTSYDYDEEIKMTKDRTLYAQWEEDSDNSGDNGSDKDVLITDITIVAAGDANTITTSAGTLQMNANILPVDADNQNVTWSVANTTGKATISEDGLLTAASNGKVTVKATAKDNSGVSGTKVITITGQSTSGGDSSGGSGSGGNTDDGSGTTTSNDVFITSSESAALLSGSYDTIRVAATGTIELNNVQADTLIINTGTGITLTNCTIKNIELFTADTNNYSIESEGTTVKTINAKNGVTLSGTGYGTLNVYTSDVVTLDGTIDTVNVSEGESKIKVPGTVATMNVLSDADDSIITGTGTITTLQSSATIKLGITNLGSVTGAINNSEINYGSIENAEAIDAATKAVEQAEKTFVQTDLDKAVTLVDVLSSDLSEKTSLQKRVTEVQAVIDATKAVVELEDLKKASDLDGVNSGFDAAKSLVNAINTASAKSDLKERLDAINTWKELQNNLKAINDAIKAASIDADGITVIGWDSTVNQSTFTAAGVENVTVNNLEKVKLELVSAYKNGSSVDDVSEIQIIVNKAINDYTTEKQITLAKTDANASITAAQTVVNGLFSDSTNATIKDTIGQAAITAAKVKVDLAQEKITAVKDLGANASDVKTLQDSFDLINADFEKAAIQVTAKEVNGLFEDPTTMLKLKQGVGKTQISSADTSVTTIESYIENNTDVLALRDKVTKAQQLLVTKNQAAVDLWDTVSLDTTKCPALTSKVTKSKATDVYTLNISLPTSITSSYVMVENKLYLGNDSNNLINTFDYNDSIDMASVLIDINNESIDLPVMFASGTGISSWNYNTGCKESQAYGANTWEKSITTSDGYVFKFNMTHKLVTINKVSYDVFTMTMTPQ